MNKPKQIESIKPFPIGHLPAEEQIKIIGERLKDYPVDHVDRIKGTKQILKLKEKRK